MSNEPSNLSSFYLILSHEVWKPLYDTVTKKPFTPPRDYFQELKKENSIHMSSQGKQAFLREIPAGLL